MTPAETEYREHSAKCDQALAAAHGAPIAAVVDRSLMEAQIYATRALAAATLMVYDTEPEIRSVEALDTVELRTAGGKSIAKVAVGPAPPLPGEAIEDYVDRLNESLEAARLALIEAQNPGIDMDAVRRHRAAVRSGVVEHLAGTPGGRCASCQDLVR